MLARKPGLSAAQVAAELTLRAARNRDGSGINPQQVIDALDPVSGRNKRGR